MRILALRFLLVVVLGAASVQAPAFAAPPKARAVKEQPFTSPEQILKWIDGYRHKPEPKRVPGAVKTMSEMGLFKEQETSGVYVGFIAGVLGAHPEDAELLVTGMFPMPPVDQVALIRAIAYSGLPGWKALLTKFVERMPARKVLIDRYLTDKLPTLDKLPLETSPAGLDTLWGYYFATGSVMPVQRIVGALAWSSDKEDVDKLTIGNMAKWTLANNASRDVDLLRLCKSELRQQPKPVTKPLEEVIEAAETFELGKIRKEAMASIEDLKRRGPASKANMGWWATAGTTLITLGCVAASAAGQIQFGLPCIIGGPASQAAAKLLLPQ